MSWLLKVTIAVASCLFVNCIFAKAKPADSTLSKTTVVPLDRVLELVFVPTDPEQLRQTCPQTSYIWPRGCLELIPGGYSVLLAAGEKLQSNFTPQGTFDVTATLKPPGPDYPENTLRGTVRAVHIGKQEQRLEITMVDSRSVPQMVLHVQVVAESPFLQDGDICAGHLGVAGECSSNDQQHACRVEVPTTANKSRVFANRGCSRPYLYDELKLRICQAGLHMRESVFAAAFKCQPLGEPPYASSVVMRRTKEKTAIATTSNMMSATDAELKTSIMVDSRRLEVTYQIQNLSGEDIFVLDGLWRNQGSPELDQSLAYTVLQGDTMTLFRGLVPIPQGMQVELPEVPYARILPAGASLTGVVSTAIPLLYNHPYDQSEHPSPPQERKIRFRIGYLLASDLPATPSAKEIGDSNWYRFGYRQIADIQRFLETPALDMGVGIRIKR